MRYRPKLAVWKNVPIATAVIDNSRDATVEGVDIFDLQPPRKRTFELFFRSVDIRYEETLQQLTSGNSIATAFCLHVFRTLPVCDTSLAHNKNHS
jgi:hypothetical protein